MKALTSSSRLTIRLVRCCVGSIFVGGVSAVIVYAFHGWTWPSEINGVALNLPEFVAVVMLLAFVVGYALTIGGRSSSQSTINHPVS
jgi:hypothetical protein